MRLQKWIAASGAMSRRRAEEAIVAGRVAVNGKTITELGSVMVPGADEVRLDGELIVQPEQRRILAFHKPRRVMTTKHDPEGRRTIMAYFPPELQRLNPVGRLDFDSEGLLIVTDDGALATNTVRIKNGDHALRI